jgi:hypothetical protein
VVTLTGNKSGFIYSWNKCKANRIVYGVNADSDINENNDYRGSFDSNNPRRSMTLVDLMGSFGMVIQQRSVQVVLVNI